MGANHHIHLTTKIALSMSREAVTKENLLLPTSYQNDFECVYKEDYIQESPELPDGTRLKFEKTFLVFALKKEYLQNVHNFLIDSLKIVNNIIYKDNIEMSKDLDEFLNIFKNIEIDIDTLYNVNRDKFEELSNKLRNIDCNFFTDYTEVPIYAVYDGIPNDFIIDDRQYSFVGFDIVHSYFKLNESRDETILFTKLKEKLMEQKKYQPLNKYILHLGY